MHHFLALDREQQRIAMTRLAACGYTDVAIAAATKLSVEAVRQILGEAGAPGPCSR